MKKYRVHIVFDVLGWAHHKRAIALKKYCPEDVEISIAPLETPCPTGCDLWFVLDYRALERARKQKGLTQDPVMILGSYNRGDFVGNGRTWLDVVRNNSDRFAVTNKEIYKQVLSLTNKVSLLYTGVDTDIFKVTRPTQQRDFKILWTGSAHHRKIKRYDSLVVPVAAELDKEGIKHDFCLVDSLKPPRNTPQMADWYNTGTVYLMLSETEGVANTGVEASACGCFLVTTRAGSMTSLIEEGANGFFVEPTVQSVLSAIKKARDVYIKKEKQIADHIKDWSWETRSKDFYSLFRKMVDKEI